MSVPEVQIGIGYRYPLKHWILEEPGLIECLEITAEHFFEGGQKTLAQLSSRYPTYVHGLGLSLGTPGELDYTILDQFKKVADDFNAEWISEHIAFTRAGEIDLGHLNPVPRTPEMLRVLTDHVKEVSEYCKRPMILENITSHLDIGGELEETEFLNRLCSTARCGLLLDVTNLFINSKNHNYDANAWLQKIQPEYIQQLHVVGYSKTGDSYEDHHSAVIQEELMELLGEVLNYAPVKSIILERDENLSNVDEIRSELERLKVLVKSRHI